MVTAITEVVIDSHQGPSREPRYRSLMSCNASAVHIQLLRAPSARSRQARAARLGRSGNSSIIALRLVKEDPENPSTIVKLPDYESLPRGAGRSDPYRNLSCSR